MPASLWELLALLVVGAVGVGTLAASNAKVMTTQGKDAADAELLQRAVQAASAHETDLTVLHTFKAKLIAASYPAYASMIDRRIAALSRIFIGAMPIGGPLSTLFAHPIQTTQSGATYQSTVTPVPRMR